MGKYTPKLPTAVIEFEVKNENGKTLQKGKFAAKSWVGRIIEVLHSLISAWSTSVSTYACVCSQDVKCASGNNVALAIYSGSNIIGGGCAPAGADYGGIVVGTSDTPVSLDQYALQAKISHGTGSGQLSYGATTVESITTGTTWMFRVLRTFTNNSGSSITIKELGLFVAARNTNDSFMLCRDVPTSAITVPNGSTLTLRYIISYSLS